MLLPPPFLMLPAPFHGSCSLKLFPTGVLLSHVSMSSPPPPVQPFGGPSELVLQLLASGDFGGALFHPGLLLLLLLGPASAASLLCRLEARAPPDGPGPVWELA